MKKIAFIFILTLIFTHIVASVILPEEKKIIENLLLDNGLELSDPDFLKDWSPGTDFKLKRVVKVLNQPMIFPQLVDSLDITISSGDVIDIVDYMIALTDTIGEENPKIRDLFNDDLLGSPQVYDTASLIEYVNNVWSITDYHWQKTWNNLSREEIEQLRYFTASMHMEAEDSLRYDRFFVERDIQKCDSLDMEYYVELFKLIDFQQMKLAAYYFEQGFTKLTEYIRVNQIYAKRKLEAETDWGRIAIGTMGRDFYDGDYAVIIDPGGDDYYNIGMNTDYLHPMYWLIDVNGDDTYRSDEIHGLFSSFWGLGVSADFAGNDIYSANDYLFSAVMGFNCHVDDDGDDIYAGGLHSIAAASFGYALLTDNGGDDSYDITQFGQGYAGPLSCAVLADYDGDDIYNAGRKYYHAPLAPFDHRSMAQGFGFGLRPYLGGGIGVLFDGQGNDHFNGGVYSQAVAYWYALGIIIDKSGNDFYDAVYYPQGSGIHLAGGFLFDNEGEDHYYSKHGPGQGAAHDYAVGFLIDRSGDDSYSVEGGNGLALTNSVALFLDVKGNDRYERFNKSNFGHTNVARDAGGIGLFIDTGGEDNYNSSKAINDSTWISGTYGLGLDIDLFEDIDKVEEAAMEEASVLDTTASIDEIFAVAAQWGVGSGKKRVEQAGLILLQRDDEAAKYIYNEQLGTKSGLTYRAIKNYTLKSEVFPDFLLKALTHEDSLWNKNAIAFLSEIGDSIYIDTLTTFISKKKYVNTVLSALGGFKCDKAVNILKDYAEDDSERRRIIVARSLKEIDIPLSRKYLYQMKNDKSFLIKTMIKLAKDKEKG